MQPDHEPDSAANSPFQPSQFRILGVDDEPLNLLVLKKHLIHQNYQFEQAESGEEALTKITEDGPFDLILLDIMMPKMDGLEVCRRIRAKQSHTELPVIFVTARNQKKDMELGFEAGGNDFIPKPFTRKLLQYRIEIQLKWLMRLRVLEQENTVLNKVLENLQSTS